jgi:hypothetical protein
LGFLAETASVPGIVIDSWKNECDRLKQQLAQARQVVWKEAAQGILQLPASADPHTNLVLCQIADWCRAQSAKETP